ncbi:Zinc finger protein 180 [Nymphon striatum]|nr:Zinc finger protein 180 [Nymphon striatum]
MTSHSKMELVDWRRKSIKKEPEFDIEQNAATADFALGWLPLEIQTVKEENEDSPSSVFEQQCAGSTKENDNNELYEVNRQRKSNNNFSTPESISHSESVVEPEKVESQGTRDGHGRCLCSKTKDGVKNKETIKKSVGLQLRMTLKGIGMDMDGVYLNEDQCCKNIVDPTFSKKFDTNIDDVYNNSHRTQWSLKTLKSDNKERKAYECNFCHERFIQEYNFKLHMQTHTKDKPFECNVCNKYFPYIGKLIDHMRTHTNVKPYECNVCHKTFATSRQLASHVQIHTNEKPYECDICHKLFTEIGNLEVHMCMHANKKPFKCNICHKYFATSSQFGIHVQEHTKEKPFTCDICHKYFTERSHFEVHMCMHENKKPFKCDVCHKCFVCRSILSKHMLIHANAKPFECNVCHKSYIRRDHLKNHMYIHMV